MERVHARWLTWFAALAAAICLGIAPVWSQTTEKAGEAAKNTADKAKETAKDTTKETKDTARDAAKETKETARDTVKDTTRDARGTARDAREGARDTARDAREGARDTARDARGTARDAREGARDTARDARGTAREGARDTVRDTREGARDAVRDVREGARETTRDVRRESRSSFRAQSTRSADFGLWFGRSTGRGLVISDVATTGAIARFGFREGDTIVSVGGHRLTSEADFVRFLFADDVRDTRVRVVVLRGGREEVIFVEPAVLIEEMYVVHEDPLEDFGIVLDDRYTDRIVVWKVLPRTPAFYAGFRSGDVITTFHGRRIASPREFVQIVQRTDPGLIAVDVVRGQRARSLEVDFRTRAESRTALRPNFEQGVERRTERREERREGREERREGVKERIDQPATGTPGAPTVTPGTDVTPQPQPQPTRPGRPRLFPRRR